MGKSKRSGGRKIAKSRRASDPSGRRTGKKKKTGFWARAWKKWRRLGLGSKVVTFSGTVAAVGAIVGAVWSTASAIYPSASLKDKIRSISSYAISVNVDRLGDLNGEGIDWVFPRRISLTTSQMHGMDYALNGAAKDGAYILNEALIGLRISSRRNEQIIITDVAAVDVARVPAVNGTLIHLNGAGEVLSKLVIRFDQAPPVVEAHRLRAGNYGISDLDDPRAVGDLYSAHPDIALNNGDTAAMSIGVASVRYAVTFRLRVTYAIGGQKQQSVTVGADSKPHGMPFRVTPSCVNGHPIRYANAYSWGNEGSEADLSPMPKFLFNATVANGCGNLPRPVVRRPG
ncbi:hypothetical protein AB0L00_11245 [Actinoallomurus sp. NPDC052308]|uniref:hypothetical protein n=1 Tax=Actinoallomurus sp. NPDC052308 TaxID=3155530 RepID=UPI0034461120